MASRPWTPEGSRGIRALQHQRWISGPGGDPLLRRIHTSMLLARQTNPYNTTDVERGSLAAWLAAIEAVNAREFQGAERLGWLCYQAGQYKEARRWVVRAPKNSTYALWLRGKLAAREGRNADALEALSRATRMLAREKEPALEGTTVTPDEQTPAEALLAAG